MSFAFVVADFVGTLLYIIIHWRLVIGKSTHICLMSMLEPLSKTIAIGVIAESVPQLTWGRHFLVEWSAPPGQWKCKLDQRQRGAYGDGVSSKGKRQLLRSHWLH